MEVLAVPDKDQELVKLMVEDYLSEKLGLNAPIDWLYFEDRQSLVARFQDASVVKQFISTCSCIQIDDKVSYKVCKYEQEPPRREAGGVARAAAGEETALKGIDQLQHQPGKQGEMMLQVELESVPPAIADFVLERRKVALDALLAETGCSISRGERGVLTAVYSPPGPSAQHRTSVHHLHIAKQKLLAFFAEYRVDTVQVVHGIWDALLNSDVYNDALNSCSEDLTVLRPEAEATSASRTLNLIGSREAVLRAREQIEQAVRDINDEMERKRQVTQVTESGLSEWSIGLLKASGFFEALPQCFSGIAFELDEGARQVHLSGLPSDIQLCLTSLRDTVSGSAERMLEWSAATVELVRKESVRQLIDAKLIASGLARSCVWWVGQDGRVCVRGLTEEDAQRSAALIGQQIVDNRIALEPEAEQLLESDKWKNEVSSMSEKRGGNVVITPTRNPLVLFVACLESDGNLLLEEVRTFLSRHVMKKQFLRMSTVIMRLLTGSMKAHVDRLVQSLSRNGVKLEARLDPGQIGFHIEGYADDCKSSQKMIKDLVRKEKVVTREHVLNVPGALASLTGNGSLVLQEVSLGSGTHIQMYDEEAAEEPASDAADERYFDLAVVEAVTLPGGVRLSIAKADITELDCEVIVNPCNQSLHHAGGLAKIISDKAGPDLDRECQAYLNSHNGRLRDGEACITGAGHLRHCKLVVHAVGPIWQGGARNESHKLYMAVTHSLWLAEESNCSSIAVPPISSGIFGYPLDKCTQTIVDSVVDHCEDPYGTPLKQVILVDVNDNGVALFRRALDRKLGNVPAAEVQEPDDVGGRREDPFPGESFIGRRSRPSTEVPLTSFDLNARADAPAMSPVEDDVLMVNGIRVELLKDNLFKLQVESLVCTVTSDLDLSKGVLSQLLSQHAGPGLQQELTANNTTPIKEGAVVVAAGHQLQHCKLVLLACCPPCQQSTSAKVIKNLVLDCLNRASKQNIKSVAFPAIGTGNLSFPAEEVASCMFEAFIEFSKKNRNPSNIKLVVAKDDLISVFKKELQHASRTIAAAVGSASASFSSRVASTALPSQQATASSQAAPTGRELCFHLLEERVKTTTGLLQSRESSADLVGDFEELLTDDNSDDPIDLSTAFAMRLSITGPEAKLTRAIDMLAERCGSRLETKTVKDPREAILALTFYEVHSLSKQAVHYGVLLTVSQDELGPEVTLSSMDIVALQSMQVQISRMLLQREAARLQEEVVGGKVQWQYRVATAAAEWRNYPPSLNTALEEASKSKPTYKYGPPGNGYVVDLVNNVDCSEADLRDTVEVRRWNVHSVLPMQWSQAEGYFEVPLDLSCKEYQDVTKAFASTLTGVAHTVIEVKRVENPWLYQQYQMHKERVRAGLSPGCKLELERKLWHGTAEDKQQPICRKGFNRSYSGKNATVYGQGVYFARDARYSCNNNYSVPNAAKEKYMIYCLVLTGEYEIGTETMRVPNSKPGQPMAQYDTTVDQLPNPSIFVTYNDAQAYPAYTVKFKLS